MILTGGRVAESAVQARSCAVEIGRARVSALSSRRQVSTRKKCLDASGYLILPGLINAHDHLEFNLYPRLGRGPYPNSKAWAEDIYFPDRDPIRKHQQVSKRVRLLWGGLKSLLSGVTTVCHHNVREDPTLDRGFPVKVLRQFGWAHSLEFSPDLRQRFLQTPRSWPFIVHLGEATDARGRREIFDLHAMGALDDRTVLVHAVALGAKGAALAKERGGSLVWCPSSNLFLLGRTLTKKILQCGLPVALGSDSALTGEGDLLDELRVGRQCSDLDCRTMYRMVTEVPRRLLHLAAGYGALVPGSPADLALYRDLGTEPAEALFEAGPPELVMVGGRIKLVSSGLADRVPKGVLGGMSRFRVEGREMFCDLEMAEMFRATEAILGPGFRLAGKQVAA